VSSHGTLLIFSFFKISTLYTPLVALVGHQNNNVHKRGPQCTNDQVHFVAFATTAFYEPEVHSHTYHTPTYPADAYSKFSFPSKWVMFLTPCLSSIVDVYERPKQRESERGRTGLFLPVKKQATRHAEQGAHHHIKNVMHMQKHSSKACSHPAWRYCMKMMSTLSCLLAHIHHASTSFMLFGVDQ
jgi:hypothetical protein